MDASKVNRYMDQFAAIQKQGGSLSPEHREALEKFHAAPTLDRVDVHVLVRNPLSDAVMWEKHEGVNEFLVDDNGVLSILIGGRDADGDWCTKRNEVYPTGRWMKMSTELTTVPNPFYIDPDKADPRDGARPVGF